MNERLTVPVALVIGNEDYAFLPDVPYARADAVVATNGPDAAALPLRRRAPLALRHSTLFLLGAEESYGYLADDAVRDKDANGATLMFAEVAAYASSIGKTIPGLLDDVFNEFGYHAEIGKSLVMEGADGAVSQSEAAGLPAGGVQVHVDVWRDAGLARRPADGAERGDHQ